MTTLTLKLPKALDEQLATVAKHRRSSKTALVRQAIEAFLAQHTPPEPPTTTLTVGDLVGHLAGCLEGPPDLSTNKKYFEGFGE